MRHKEFEKNSLFPFMRGMAGSERREATEIILFIALVNNLNRSPRPQRDEFMGKC